MMMKIVRLKRLKPKLGEFFKRKPRLVIKTNGQIVVKNEDETEVKNNEEKQGNTQ